MGWDFTRGATKRSIIDDLIRDRTGKTASSKTLRHHVNDNVLWTVRETTDTDGASVRWIGCELLAEQHDYGWGSKSMEESQHPYFYDCPLEFLDDVPMVTCQEWRDVVRRHWREKGSDAPLPSALPIGDARS
ncbi:MAG: hypothetical protein ABIQ65_04160 [Thermoanaerobaculia bacterium]